MSESYLENDPLWYKEAIIYELHVRAFYDSDGDGIGDFRGLTQKLDYLEDLGITAIWLLPFYPSPLKDDGYDISDYFKIHKDYGTLRDFKDFLRAAHKRGIRVITELVLNHTSNEHIWFLRARRAKLGSKERDWYVWSDSTDKYKDARIIFQDFETSNWAWDPVAGAYFWHRFYSHQPDLNFDNPTVRKEMNRALDFWFSLGIDGLRLDAVPYLFERDGTNCENLPETHAFLKRLRAHVDKKFKDKMFLAEANQWPEDAAAYFGSGDECHMAFHFPIMPRIFMAVQMEDSFPIIDILNSTPTIPQECQWATFLRNHDELTLEMVTDEERDYMYRLYVKDPRAKINVGIRRRLAPLLSKNRKKIELLNILLFSLPGTPVLYYGDEIGMGDNFYLGDRNGVRTPMQWSSDKNAGFSKANPQQLYLPVIIDPDYHYETINVENEDRNLSSLLWWMKRVIAMRKHIKPLGRGDLRMVSSDNNKVLSFTRRYQDETVVVAVNLSRFSQVANLDLSQYAGLVPEEVFSRNKFPIIKENPYVLTMGPHDHFWLLLQESRSQIVLEGDKKPLSALAVKRTWDSVFKEKQKKQLEELILPMYLQKCRWFGAKARTIRDVKIAENAPFLSYSTCRILLLEVYFTEGAQELYLLPVSFMFKDAFNRIQETFPQSVIASLTVEGKEGVLYDSVYSEEFRSGLFTMIMRKKKLQGKAGDFFATSSGKIKPFLKETKEPPPSLLLDREQSNTSFEYGKKFILKLYRRIDEGINPELEITKFITENTTFPNIPAFFGAIEYKREKKEPATIAILQEFVENTGDAWTYSLDVASQYFENILAKKDAQLEIPQKYPSLLDCNASHIPPFIAELIGDAYLNNVSLLGKRTAELHIALSSIVETKEFAPEPFSVLYQRSIYQSVQGLINKAIQSLKKNLGKIPKDLHKEVDIVISSQDKMLKIAQKILQKKISAMKMRIHGDYHLGQVLHTGKDFVIIDFEGEPARPSSERRLKQFPFKDVAGLIRSLHYAAHGALFLRSSVRHEDVEMLRPWVTPWYIYTSGLFLHSYLETIGDKHFIPKQRDELEILLQVFLLEKAVYEIIYELNNRPDWLVIPLKGIETVIETPI